MNSNELSLNHNIQKFWISLMKFKKINQSVPNFLVVFSQDY